MRIEDRSNRDDLDTADQSPAWPKNIGAIHGIGDAVERHRYGRLAQMVEQYTVNVKVGGSIPPPPAPRVLRG